MKLIALFLLSLNALATPTISVQEFTAQSIQGIPTNAKDFASGYMNPTLGNEQISTPNGTTFDVNLSCPTSNAFLQVFAQAGTSGDLSLLQFSRDKDLDGNIDQVQNFPKPVSGICTTGLISCDAGTWDNCSGYKWDAQNDNLSLIETGIGNLGGCYCINGSCGDTSKSTRIISSIVSDLGSSAAIALAKNNPQYQISGAQTTGPIARFYGQKLVGCGDGNATQMASYYQNPQNIESESSSLANNTDGVYQLIANSPAAKKSITTSKSCSIARHTSYQNIQLEDIISYNGGTGGIHRCAGDGCLELVLGRVGDNYWDGHCNVQHQKVSFFVNMPERISQATLVNARWDDWIRVAANNQKIYAHPYPNWDGQTIPSGSRCEWSTSWNTSPNTNFTNLIKQQGKIDFTVDVQISGGGEGYAYAQVFVDESCALDQEWLSNSCETVEQDKKCTLKNETIDGVQTYKNYHPTGKTPIATQRQVGGDSCDLNLKRNWWRVDREYECKTNIDLNFDEAIARNASVQDSATTQGYSDIVDGVTTSATFDLPDIKISSCSNACKTKRIKDKVSVSGQGPVSSKTGQEWETLYRKCTGENQSICPNEQGEQVITQCSCLNEFGTASTMMQSLRQAAQDLICTTGSPQSF
ncbi:hypothetical protein [uncultured Gammaproteobacteria bacterium]|uniref:hypothetical protein n=1 Tax=Bathymodiolus heckerae thiotrophic gill symbiont TaxID=1052212 RepID=UPI0010B5FA5E|nr:hypothetical protein [Bathymodiolus heckerae thiotrophic gill symbiont]CAC9527460.1 hypothetical protein [uncultured Gammaproteobacteria bacterium]CAC9588248.1 hypothetical protein [uncultured Gammaproteobacteria bacterium]CAC9959178.1 hypothetical protein [uncultured Gammaproteobacteria bacterium]SHN89533.1 hypothetical protein BHECKSOX_2006 [Bathymodiolus heckerae thiotrophic gill symbiont]